MFEDLTENPAAYKKLKNAMVSLKKLWTSQLSPWKIKLWILNLRLGREFLWTVTETQGPLGVMTRL